MLDYAGVAVFAASGALMAAEKRQDLLTFVFFAAITGGGGTLRDLLIAASVFGVQDAGHAGACAVVAVAVWVMRGGDVPAQALLWLDGVGLAVYAVVGAATAMAMGAPPAVCVVMGVLTATFGGIILDVLASEPSILLRRAIYISAAMQDSLVRKGKIFRDHGVRQYWVIDVDGRQTYVHRLDGDWPAAPVPFGQTLTASLIPGLGVRIADLIER
jgi:uncharacterized membrane protein YeiH